MMTTIQYKLYFSCCNYSLRVASIPFFGTVKSYQLIVLLIIIIIASILRHSILIFTIFIIVQCYQYLFTCSMQLPSQHDIFQHCHSEGLNPDESLRFTKDKILHFVQNDNCFVQDDTAQYNSLLLLPSLPIS